MAVIDLIATNGRISTFADPGEGPGDVEAIAMSGGRIVAAGSAADIAPLEPLAARVIDLRGRRAIPGLNDSHIHAVRAGVSWSVSLHWEDVRSVSEALETITTRTSTLPAGGWIPAIGGWHRRQFAERRLPTPAELTAAAPRHPVYVQETYDVGVLNRAAMAVCGWGDEDTADPPGGRLERDERGVPTGVVHGMGAFAVPTAKALAVDAATAEAGTLAMLREFAAHGLTGVVDGGGLMMTPGDYRPLHALWRAGSLPVRVRTFVSAWDRGGEVGNIEALTAIAHPDFGDDVLRVSGIGEVIHLGCHDLEGLEGFDVAPESVEELVAITRVAVARGWRMSMHAVLNDTLSRVLDAWERVERETGGIRGANFSIVHADAADTRNLDRMAALGLGVLVQNRHLLKSGDYVERWGREATAAASPIADIRARGIPIGAGTDATRANWFSPWASIWWLVTGRCVDGEGARDPRHLMSREDALRAYTTGSAWFTGEEGSRGKLLPGHLGDFTVPTADPFTCGEDELRELRSDLTVMGGVVTHASRAFA